MAARTWSLAIGAVLAAVLCLHLASCGDDATKPSAPCVALPDTLDFGTVLLGVSDTLGVTVHNAGKEPLTLSPKLDLGDESASPVEFSLVGVDSAGVAVLPDSTASFAVTFAPYTVGAKDAWLDLGGNGCPGIPIRANAESILCDGVPDTLDFGDVTMDTSASRTFTIRNEGTLILSGSVEMSCEHFTIEGGSGQFILLPGQIRRVTVKFTSPDPGSYECTVDLRSRHCGTVLCRAFTPTPHTARWTVRKDGTGDVTTVQAGIDRAASQDTVLVGPGRYVENVVIDGKDVVLIGEAGAEETTLDGSAARSCVVYFGPATTRRSLLQGFTVTGGLGWSDPNAPYGGGILVDRGSPVIRKNIIRGNAASGPENFGLGGGL